MKPAAAAAGDLIPGIPNDVAELCLLRLPFPHSFLSRSVSLTWKQTLSNPSFLRSKSRSSHLFTLAFDTSTHRLQWQAFDPRSRRWFVLPPMPSEDEDEDEDEDENNNASGGGTRIFGPSLACAADGERGEIYVIGGMRAEEEGEMMRSVAVYSAASNSWRAGSGMRRGRAFFAAAAIGGRVYVAGGGDGEIADAECYDPARDRWDDVAPMTSGIPRYS